MNAVIKENGRPAGYRWRLLYKEAPGLSIGYLRLYQLSKLFQ